MANITLLFFRGCTIVPDGLAKSLIPMLIRFCTWPRGRVHFNNVPAHVAIAIDGTEYESIVTGIRKQRLEMSEDGNYYGLHNLIKQIHISVEDDKSTKVVSFLESQVGQPYGYISVVLTGVGNLKGDPPLFTKRLWEKLKSGRTAPKSCSYLCQVALAEADIVLKRDDDLPMSPMDLFDAVRKI